MRHFSSSYRLTSPGAWRDRCGWPLALAAVISCGACTKVTQPAPAEQQAPHDDVPRRTEPRIPDTCKSDLDCETCGSKPDCRRASASCWEGKCVLRHEAAAPCHDDAQCEVRANRCKCDLYPALVSAPLPEEGCIGQGCAPQPDPERFVARCDPDAHRCVLHESSRR